MSLPLSDEMVVMIGIAILLSGILRWAFGGPARAERKLTRARDYGLLHEIATTSSERAAQFAREQLRHNGIRATTAPGDDGATQRVLVFPADAARAADVLMREGED
jgi:hypothetical protein